MSRSILNAIAISAQCVPSVPVVLHFRLKDQQRHTQINKPIKITNKATVYDSVCLHVYYIYYYTAGNKQPSKTHQQQTTQTQIVNG